MAALQLQPAGEERSTGLDTVILATTNVRAGELWIGSRRVQSRLVPLADSLPKFFSAVIKLEVDQRDRPGDGRSVVSSVGR